MHFTLKVKCIIFILCHYHCISMSFINPNWLKYLFVWSLRRRTFWRHRSCSGHLFWKGLFIFIISIQKAIQSHVKGSNRLVFWWTLSKFNVQILVLLILLVVILKQRTHTHTLVSLVHWRHTKLPKSAHGCHLLCTFHSWSRINSKIVAN